MSGDICRGDWCLALRGFLFKQPSNNTNINFCKVTSSINDNMMFASKCTTIYTEIHLKILIEVAMVLSTNSGSFPSNSHVSATFLIWLRFGEFWIRTNCEKLNADGSLMGRTNLDKSVWQEQRSELRPIAK